MKRGLEKQLTLPFDADLVTSIFVLFEPEIPKWHKLQDQPESTSGNDYAWWASRWGDWLQDQRKNWSTEKYLETYQLFPRIWERYEEKLTRRKPSGIPKWALEK